jgi:hypothetical protein
MSPDSLDAKQKLARLVRWVIVLVVLSVVASLLMHFVTTGTVNITTGNSATAITISSMPTSASKATIVGKGTGSLNIRVAAGMYVISVQNGQLQTDQSVSVGWLSNKNIDLNPSGGAAIEPVLYESVQNVAVDATRIIYLNNDFNGIEYINDQNQDAPISGQQYFTSVDWADAQYGVAQALSGKLYVVDGDAAHPLVSPISNSNDSHAAFAIAPNKTIYLGLGSNVYRGTETGGFTQISSDFSSSDHLVAANDEVMIVNSGQDGASGTATVIGTDGQTVSKNFSAPLGGWTSWSESGQYVVITVGAVPELFDASLKQIATIPELGAISNGVWQGDNTLFYYSAGQLWSYNQAQSESNLLATVPDQKLIQGITLSPDGSYVYVTTSDTNSPSYPRAAFRVGLRGQTVAADISTLGDVLPIDSPTYTAGLRNFSGPLTIVVSVNQGYDLGIAQQEVEDAMQGMINLNDVKFDVEQGD